MLITAVIPEGEGEEKILDGMIEPLSPHEVKGELRVNGYGEFASFFISAAPVKTIMKPPLNCSGNTPLSMGISHMKENGTTIVVVLNNEGEPMGTADAGTIVLPWLRGCTRLCGFPHHDISSCVHQKCRSHC